MAKAYLPALPPILAIRPPTSRIHQVSNIVARPRTKECNADFNLRLEQIVEQICKLAKKGASRFERDMCIWVHELNSVTAPSQIGVVLRDSHGIPQVKVITGMAAAHMRDTARIWLTRSTGNKILRILKGASTTTP